MNARFLAAAKRNDFLARWGITLGGISIIGSMLVMIVFMVQVTLPLFSEPDKELRGHLNLDLNAEDVAYFAPGPYLERGFVVKKDGMISFFDLKDGNPIEEKALDKPDESATRILRAQGIGKETFNLHWDSGGITEVEVGFKPHFDNEGNRTIHYDVHTLVNMPALETADAGLPAVVHQIDEGNFFGARLTNEGHIAVNRTSREEDFMGDITEETAESTIVPESKGKVTNLVATRDGQFLFAASDANELIAWNISDAENPKMIDLITYGEKVTAMTMLFGDLTMIVGDEKGQLSAWNLVPGDVVRLRKIHDFVSHESAIATIATSYKDKQFVTLDVDGSLQINHLTSERKLVSFDEEKITAFALAERGDGLLGMSNAGDIWFWDLHIPHPEISTKTLWGKVWYEGYPEPVHAWQSSSASDDFEAKMSLVPLLWGSLKGTFYGMLFSLPLAIFAAIYTSYMMAPRWRAIVKPVVELMAAIPSVVTGFLAALWLAPRLEDNLLGLIMALVIMPIITGLGLYGMFRTKRNLTGLEFLYAVPFVMVGSWIAWEVGFVVQQEVFGGNLNLWFFQEMGLSVDQRNCVVIGFALGFAVIPIIFTISEDALFNVPKHMSAAALALGSSRWQAMRRVILPMASPGIFAATMIGFGRAVGETMIVLMATGNTPIMSPSILNGMRTLSANIAVEIPEAPVNSTLYRILFLSAVLLFSMTFIVNTAAEVVRVRLHQKYKNL